MEISKILANFGLKENESKAYLALLKLQSANAFSVAKEANIERTTIYRIMEVLANKGLASKSVTGKKMTYTAESPVRLKDLLDNQTSALTQLLPILMSMQGSKGQKPSVKFYDNVAGMRQALLDSLDCEEKIRRDFSAVSTIAETLGKRFIQNQIEERVKRGIGVRSLRRKEIEGGKVEKDWYLKSGNKDILREVRYLNIKENFEPTIFIYDHKVVIISSVKELYALVIESAEFSKAMKILFDIAWETAEL